MGALGQPHEWDFDAGLLPLDFANTAEWHSSPQPTEKLNTYEDLVAWSWAAGIMTRAEAKGLLAEAEGNPQAAAAALAQAIRLREVIYRVFHSVAASQEPDPEDLVSLNATLADALSRVKIEASPQGFSWGWSDGEPRLVRMLWPILQAAADLITSERLDRIGECADDRGCGYLFHDTSRKGNRRWCSMESCGNRAKARRHYARRKTSP